MRLTIAKSGTPVTLDPASAQSSNELTIVALAYETLVRVAYLDGEYRVVAGLASKWETNLAEDQWTFTLTERCFCDGTPVTAGAVIASLTRLKGMNSFASHRLRAIASFSAPSDAVLVIALSSADRNFLFELTGSYASIVAPAGLIGRSEQLARATFGSGAFQVSHFDEVHLRMNARQGKSDLADDAEIEFLFIEDSAERRALLEMNTVQLAENLSAADMEQLMANPDILPVSARSALLTYMVLNCRRGPFADVKIRQALADSLNFSKFAAIFGDGATALVSIVPLGVCEGFGSIRAGNAGRSSAAERLRHYLGDRPLRFLVDFPGDQSYWSDAAKLLREELNAAGIDVQIERDTFSEMRKRLDAGDFDITVVDWNLEYPDPAGVLDYWLHSAFAGLAGNFAGYSNHLVDHLLESARSARYGAAMEKLQEAERLALSDVAYIPLVQRHFHFAVRRDVKEIMRADTMGWQGLSKDGITSFFKSSC